ncbi:hypothetical protein L1987_31789 [Smallanthus sonchifolius]|uniref:Uncharacterized protein n=1 Tax=Smallanthus sonchifolius TaxID=185202 RepID=A0ACB9I6D9_9ASTR|nr:hypothetical protein L1987_31789 [Smallanthus sonchifolius]
MDLRISLLAFSLFIVATSLVSAESGDNMFIRQVVGDENHHFGDFKHKFEKSYPSQEEHDYRLSVFKANLRRAKRYQKLDPSAIHRVTQFSDMTPEEFGKHLGLRSGIKFPSDAGKAPILQTDNLPEDFDWRDHGAITGVKNQGSSRALANNNLSIAIMSMVSLDEDHIAANLVKHGPLATDINAAYMQTYIGGVSCPFLCSKRLDHGVLLVGYGAAGYAPIRMKEKPYWIIKNSWGRIREKRIL